MGSPDKREGSGGVGGATSAEPANEGWLIRVSTPFVLVLRLLTRAAAVRAAARGWSVNASAERRDGGGDLRADRLGQRRVPDRSQVGLAGRARGEAQEGLEQRQRAGRVALVA